MNNDDIKNTAFELKACWAFCPTVKNKLFSVSCISHV